MRIAATLLLLIGACPSALFAQPAFEVATVRPNHSGEPPRTYPRLRNGSFIAENASLKTLLSIAFGLVDLRIVGPAWLDTERYDITAKAPEGIPDSQLKPLLQALLRDRFHLTTHSENRQMPAYDLTVGRSGSKLTLFDPAHPPAGSPNSDRGQTSIVGVGTTGQIADALARAVGRPVVDKTGLDGRYGWALNYEPVSAANSSADAVAPEIFSAIEQQLGLKLESRKESLEIVVIDHVDRIPAEN